MQSLMVTLHSGSYDQHCALPRLAWWQRTLLACLAPRTDSWGGGACTGGSFRGRHSHISPTQTLHSNGSCLNTVLKTTLHRLPASLGSRECAASAGPCPTCRIKSISSARSLSCIRKVDKREPRTCQRTATSKSSGPVRFLSPNHPSLGKGGFLRHEKGKVLSGIVLPCPMYRGIPRLHHGHAQVEARAWQMSRSQDEGHAFLRVRWSSCGVRRPSQNRPAIQYL